MAWADPDSAERTTDLTVAPQPRELDQATCMLAQASQDTRELAQATASAHPGARGARSEPVLPPGTMVGRYVVLGPLGSGGMSVVYTAFDRDLDRKIAIKLLRSAYWDAEGQLRVLREAQAMAKLPHPNVISVYDVGRLNDQLFIAMELIDGVTLRDWLGQEPRSWRQVVDVMAQVGRGLAAAHQSGLLHRDVKPANIMIDRGGRARIMDFGIARPMRLDDAREFAVPVEVRDDSSTSGTGSGSSALNTPMTQHGAVVGTPSYMAPEQSRGVTDARTDQFSFSVTLYEALHGARPQLGRELPVPDPTRRVPGWLRAAVLRGMHAEPEQRYRSMDELVTAIITDVAARRRTIATTLAAVAVVGASVAVAATRHTEQPEVCRVDAQRLASAWGPDDKRAVEAAFAASGRPYAADTYARVAKLLDVRVAAWGEIRTEACAATRVRGEQSEHLLDLRMRCLDRVLAEMTALVRLFATRADPEVVDHAVEAATSLPTGAACADVEALSAVIPLPTAPGFQAQAEAVRSRLVDAAALARAGKYRDALATITPAVPAARALSYAPLEAEVLVQVAEVATRTGDAKAAEASLYQALPVASGARDDRLLVRALSRLVYVLGYQQARPAEALAIQHMVDAVLVRIGDAPDLRAKALHAIGATEFAQRRLQDALRDFERVAAIYRDATPMDAASYANALSHVSAVLGELGRHDEAVRHLEHARTLLIDALGPDHPEVAEMANNLGWVLAAQHRYPEARQAYLQALATFERTLGSRHVFVVIAQNNLGELDLAEHKPGDALARCRGLVPIAEALEASSQVASALVCTGAAMLELDDPAGAIDPLVRALALRDAAGDPGSLADVRFALARALWGAGRDRTRAALLAQQARDAYTTLGSERQEDLQRVEAWQQATHGRPRTR